MVTPEEFLTELERDWVRADPMDRHKIVMGYASLMRSRETEMREVERMDIVAHMTIGEDGLYLDQDLCDWMKDEHERN